MFEGHSVILRVTKTGRVILSDSSEAYRRLNSMYSEDTIRKIAQTSSGNITLSLNLLKALVLKAESEGVNSIDEVEYEYEEDREDEDFNADKAAK